VCKIAKKQPEGVLFVIWQSKYSAILSKYTHIQTAFSAILPTRLVLVSWRNESRHILRNLWKPKLNCFHCIILFFFGVTKDYVIKAGIECEPA